MDKKPRVKKAHTTTVLIRKLANALDKLPGIDRSVVFSGPDPTKVYAFSVYSHDPTLLMREAYDGTCELGYFAHGAFCSIGPLPNTLDDDDALTRSRQPCRDGDRSECGVRAKRRPDIRQRR
jgi:hypothetical protein